ncbi:hypothetical protein [Neolewinella antarctica]|uniref:Uncharacterized protein n=1 Tax=Neolewinella antarctica TaxID=442734 RepID=A0ABX0X9P9_9BACT|nr:hypothetical protein [Neolewinella antarctica]NJC25961.1 hypothetical protein [Neolewinella antarctica]
MLEQIFEQIYRKVSAHLNSVNTVLKFADTLWVVADASGEDMKLIFKNDGRLIVSKQGRVTQGAYEMLTEANAMIITIGDESHLYNHRYTDEQLVFLQLDGSAEQAFVLVNNSLLGEMTPQQYLEAVYLKPVSDALKLEDTKARVSKLQLQLKNRIPMSDGSVLKVCFSKVNRKLYLLQNNSFLKSKNFSITIDGHSSFFEVAKDGELKEWYMPKRYTANKGAVELTIHETPYLLASVGDRVFINGAAAPDGNYRINFFNSHQVKDGRIV